MADSNHTLSPSTSHRPPWFAIAAGLFFAVTITAVGIVLAWHAVRDLDVLTVHAGCLS